MTQPCRYTKRTLSRAITQMRKDFGSGHFAAPSKDVLGKILEAHGEAVPKTMVARKKVWKQIRSELHPTVGSMSFADMQAYVYHTAQHIGLDWSSVLNVKRERKHISTACASSAKAEAGNVTKGAKKTRARVPDDEPDSEEDIFEEADEEWYQRTKKPVAKKPAAKKPAARAASMTVAAPQRSDKEAFIAREVKDLIQTDMRLPGKIRSKSALRAVALKRWEAKQAAAADTRRERSEPRTRTLTASQKKALETYDPKRNKTRLKAAVKQFMLSGRSFAEAKVRAESRAAGETAPLARPKLPKSRSRASGRRFLDDTAQG